MIVWTKLVGVELLLSDGENSTSQHNRTSITSMMDTKLAKNPAQVDKMLGYRLIAISNRHLEIS